MSTTGFQVKCRLRNERRNSILMTCHYQDLGSPSDWLKIVWFRNFPYPPHRDLLEILTESVEEQGSGNIEAKCRRKVGHETILEFLKAVSGKGVKPKHPHREKYAPSLLVSRQHYTLYHSKACILQ